MATVANFSWKFHFFFMKIPSQTDREVVAFLWFSGLGYTVVAVDTHICVNTGDKFITGCRTISAKVQFSPNTLGRVTLGQKVTAR